MNATNTIVVDNGTGVIFFDIWPRRLCLWKDGPVSFMARDSHHALEAMETGMDFLAIAGTALKALSLKVGRIIGCMKALQE